MPLTLKRRDNGNWYITGTIDGKRYRESTRTDQKEIADLIFAEAQSKIQKAAIYGTEYEATFSDAAVKYIEEGKETRFLSPLIKELGQVKLKDIKPGVIKSTAKKLYPNCLPATQNRQGIVPAVAIINHGAELGMCHHIRVAKFKERGSKKAVAVDREWHELFIEHAINIRIAAIDLLMYSTGMRITNALELEPDDIDKTQNIGRIKETKNGEELYFPIIDELATMLTMIEPRQVRDGSIRLFGYQGRTSIYTPWQQTCKLAGIPYIPPHQCGRHTFATDMICRNKVDAKSTAMVGGWKSVRILLEKYAHPENPQQHVHDIFSGTKIKRDDQPENVVQLITKRRAKQ